MKRELFHRSEEINGRQKRFLLKNFETHFILKIRPIQYMGLKLSLMPMP